MITRGRATAVCFVPAFLLVLVVVTKLFRAWRETLSESDLHLIVFDHSSQIAAALWIASFVLGWALAWAAAGVFVRGGRGGR